MTLRDLELVSITMSRHSWVAILAYLRGALWRELDYQLHLPDEQKAAMSGLVCTDTQNLLDTTVS